MRYFHLPLRFFALAYRGMSPVFEGQAGLMTAFASAEDERPERVLATTEGEEEVGEGMGLKKRSWPSLERCRERVRSRAL